MSQDLQTLLLLLIPIILIQLGLAIYCLVDLSKRKVTRGPRWVWAVFLVFTALALPSGIILQAFYLLWGRQVEGQT